MNFSQSKVVWANSLDVDKIVPSEVKNLCHLMNAEFLRNLSLVKLENFAKKNAGVVKSIILVRRHECIMLSEEQRCISYGLEAIERLSRVLKLDYYEHAAEHFKDLGKDHEVTLSFLMNLRQNSDFSDYQAILGYLSYWIDDQ
jgi:hypothetical protein